MTGIPRWTGSLLLGLEKQHQVTSQPEMCLHEYVSLQGQFIQAACTQLLSRTATCMPCRHIQPSIAKLLTFIPQMTFLSPSLFPKPCFHESYRWVHLPLLHPHAGETG